MKKKFKTIPERIEDYLLKKKLSIDKEKIARELDLKLTQVTRGCGILRKKGVIGMHKRRVKNLMCYIVRWGIN